ncbi:MAG TPA: cytochrome c biogenesis protein CcdA [Rhizobiales bacterium]|nr:thiol:disulfide interchange protein DsbD precursor [bacterium BMS3Bbin10]HDO52057.1 cytochrome c biogenesis protein CcdA [Hyphomicrobiales bacterium]
MLEISNIGILTAFAAGIISFLSPCVLPLVPGYVSYIAGGSTQHTPDRMSPWTTRLPALGLSFCFILGFSTVFILLGAGATLLGQLLLAYSYELNIVGGAIVIGFGLFMLGVPKLSVLNRELRFHTTMPGGRPLSAYLLGLAFAFGWTPCIGPILGAILTVSAASVNVSDGVALLSIYSLGLGIPFLLTALFTDTLVSRFKQIGAFGARLRLVAGGAMIVMGVAMITGQLSAFSYWLLDAFPALATIG